MTIKEAGLVKRIEFRTEEERKDYTDWLDHIGAEYYVLSDGFVGGDNGTVWFLNIVEQWNNNPSYPLFDVETWG